MKCDCCGKAVNETYQCESCDNKFCKDCGLVGVGLVDKGFTKFYVPKRCQECLDDVGWG